jgi:Homeodomain-like domain-containing protein
MDVEKRELTALTRKHGAPQSIAERARIVLAAAGGLNNKEIAAEVGVCAATAGTWRNRCRETHGHEPPAKIGYVSDMRDLDRATVRLMYSAHWQPMDYVVRLVSTMPCYGGRRRTFLCPGRTTVASTPPACGLGKGRLGLPSAGQCQHQEAACPLVREVATLNGSRGAQCGAHKTPSTSGDIGETPLPTERRHICPLSTKSLSGWSWAL